MDLQTFLEDKFTQWSPPEPRVLKRTKCSITLDWHNVEPFHFISDELLYRLEKNEKMPPWVVVYRGGKTSKEIDNLAPRHCHKFRLRVIVKASAVPSLAARALQHYGDEAAVYEAMEAVGGSGDGCGTAAGAPAAGDGAVSAAPSSDGVGGLADELEDTRSAGRTARHKWLESRWSGLTWSSTDTDGTSAVCFCMAVRCGYLKQVQGMLDERPALIGITNSTNGFTPLATAVRKGDINTVRFLLGAGAEVEQRSTSGQAALHLAVLSASIPIVQLLLEQGADFEARDLNGLRVEHYAVDSCSLDMLRCVLDRGGDVHAEDNSGWTPLFRALCQNAATAVIEELVVRGSSLEQADRAGLPLTSAARLLRDRHGRGRDSVLRLVDSSYPHEKALANFTRLTKKIYNVQSLLKLPSPRNNN
uniref:SFRICE_013524 n=1 Tax=Spodoptera frugiperda TaxID=7108 RepID=A0A2H1W7P3_SPOFR